MSKSYHYKTIAEVRAALVNREISVQEIVHDIYERIDAVEPQVSALLEVLKPEILPSGEGILGGIPGVVKNNIAIQDVATTCASKILQSYKPPYTATSIERLNNAGAVIVGTANMDEFAMGSSTEYSAFKKTKNPWNIDRVPGGSSGGAAAAVASGMALWALGSDTGGSIRQPAALCGIVGMKPTYGRVSRYGLIAYGSSLDQIGPMTRTVYDNALVLGVIAGHDKRDSSSHNAPDYDYTHDLRHALPDTITIGIIEGLFEQEGMDPDIVEALQEAVRVYERLGAKVKQVRIPSLALSTPAYFIVSRAEAASNLARFDGIHYGMRIKNAKSLKDVYRDTRHDGFGEEVRKRIMVGNYVLSAGHAGAFYQKACEVRAMIRAELDQVFKEVDVLLLPTHPVPAFPFDAYAMDRLQMDLQDYFTCFANIAGVPALAVPCGFTKMQLPIGMQLVGKHWDEHLLYKLAYAYEQQTPWHTMVPSL